MTRPVRCSFTVIWWRIRFLDGLTEGQVALGVRYRRG